MSIRCLIEAKRIAYPEIVAAVVQLDRLRRRKYEYFWKHLVHSLHVFIDYCFLF